MGERLLAERPDTEGGERDTELHRRDELLRVARDAQHRPGAPVPLVVQLDDARPPGSHEGVLGRDEEGVQQDQDANADELQKKIHAPVTGAQVRVM